MNGSDVGHVALNVAEYKHSLPFFFLASIFVLMFCLFLTRAEWSMLQLVTWFPGYNNQRLMGPATNGFLSRKLLFSLFGYGLWPVGWPQSPAFLTLFYFSTPALALSGVW